MEKKGKTYIMEDPLANLIQMGGEECLLSSGDSGVWGKDPSERFGRQGKVTALGNTSLGVSLKRILWV